MKNKVQLIAYPNRIGHNLEDLFGFVRSNLGNSVKGLHLLPFYPSNADSGFSPLTHQKVDPVFGSWKQIREFTKDYDLCVDLMLNHISNESEEFQDYLKKREESEYSEIFIDIDRDFGDMTEEDAKKIHIRKEKQPFLPVRFGDGTNGRVWSTFTDCQIDLNYQSHKTLKLMEENMEFLSSQGVNLLRLDAFGYITKKTGTDCFLVEPDVFEKLDWFNETAKKHNMEILPEVHDHPSYQTAIASRDMYSYGFALPPLALYTILFKDSSYIKNWLRTCPHNQVTVLDTHDGITMPDVEGLLPKKEAKKLINKLSKRSGDPILRKTAANVGSVGAIYQLTTTIYSAFEEDDDKYLASRAIQMFTPGIPQVYYQGLLAAPNDHGQLNKCGDPREINRTVFSVKQAEKLLKKPVVKRLLKLLEFRNSYPAFDGDFRLFYSHENQLKIGWNVDEYYCNLEIDLEKCESMITYTENGKTKSFIV